MHLIEKNAEERYQSASGFLFDLIQVKEILEGRRKETDFILASKDFSAQFRIPEKLFGRTKEIADLHEAYRTILDGKKPFILISGYSGVGKSALVHEIHKPSIELRGLFIEGKFDQYQKNLPYSAWIQSFKEFVKNILTENEISLEKWKNIILDAVGTNGKVLTDIVPDLQFIIGHQPDVIELGPVETVNRFNTVLTNFIQHIATKDHPLAIFLDDWQWADLASLELLKVILLNPEIKNTLIICAYRDNEVDKNHPFAITLEQIKSKNIVPKEIVVSELNLETVEEIVYQSLGSQNKILAKMIHSKTKGNAFFLNEFLKSIHKENLLILDYRTGKWNPDLEKIQNLNITDNVVDLIVSKVRKLNPDTLELLKYGTCIGSQFDIGLLSIICKQSNIDIIKKLETALIDGLIFNTKSVTKYNFKIKHSSNSNSFSIYKFAHDKIQQAIYSILDEEERKKIHLQIGTLLLESSDSKEREERVFDITNQLNVAKELLIENSKKLLLAELILQSAKKVKSSTAYSSALLYINQCKSLLDESAWINHYNIISDMYIEMAEIYYLNGDLEKSVDFINDSLNKVKTNIEKGELYNL